MVRTDFNTSQDWDTVVFDKRRPGKTSDKKAVNAARRSGEDVAVEKKFGGGQNLSLKSVCPNATKLDKDAEVFRHARVSTEFKTALQQARLNKKMSQADLAKAINEKPSVINEYESGKAIPNGAIVQKLNRALGSRLPSAKN
ncbi:multiprotein-bridging factor 1, partial [Perkinsus olseni]